MTKLYFRSTINNASGLPTAEQSTLTSDKNFDIQTTNRTLGITKGNSQTYLSTTSIATTGTREYYVTRFVSEALNMSSISANTWTYAFAAYESNNSANFPVNASTSQNQPVRVNCYVWRPSTSTKVGTIRDGNTTSDVGLDYATLEIGYVTTFAGSAVSGMQNGDVIIFEVWFIVTQSSATAYTDRFYFNGSTDPQDYTTSSSAASYISTPQTLTFASATTPVQATNIQKYNIKQNIKQDSIHKYSLSVATATSIQRYNIQPEFEGFTFFCRLYIPFLKNEVIYGKRGVLFSKIDDEQVTFGYTAQVSDTGDIYYIVRHLSREYTLTALNAIDIPDIGIPDFAEEDFNSVDFFTIASVGVLPEPIPYDDMAFTYDILTHRMQIIKNGSVIADTNNNPEATGLVGHWRMVEGGDIGDDPDDPQTYTRTVYNSVETGNNGVITNASWSSITDKPHETYLNFDGSGDYVTVNNYTNIQTFTALTISCWFYPKTDAATANIIQKGTGDNSFLISHNTGDDISFAITNGSSTTETATANNVMSSNNQWYHIVSRWTAGGNVKINVDNGTVQNSAGTLSGSINTTDALIFGGSSNTPDGIIHDVKIWNRELTNTEVTNLYNEGHPHSGFPAWQANPPPPPEIPEPITNPFVEIYNLVKPAADWTWQKLHKLVVSGFTEIYSQTDGTTIPEQSVPFSTVYDFSGVGGGGGTEEVIYDVSQSSSSHVELNYEESIKAGQQFNSGSAIGKTVTKVTARGRVYGSPSGTVYCRVWNSGGSVKGTIGQYSVGSFPGQQFTGSGSVTLAAGDVVGIEYSGGDNNNGIELDQNDSNPYSAGNAKSSAGSGWDDNDVSGSTDIGLYIIAGGGGSAGELPLQGDDSHLGAGVYASSGGSLVNKTITRATFLLKRTGSPGGTVTARVYNSPGSSTVLQTFNSNDIPLTATNITFTNLANTRALVAGSWVGVTVSSASTSNYISTFNGPGASNGGQEVRYKDTYTPPFFGVNYQWQVQSATDCAAKLEVGGTTTPAKLHYYNLNGGAVLAVGQDIGSSGTFVGKKITRVKPKLKAVGNPTGTIFCRIRNSSGSLVSTCGSVEADSISPTDFSSYEFTNLLQNRNLATGDKIMIEYSGTATNYVQIMIKHGGGGSDNVTVFNGSSYSTIDADISGQVYTGGTASDPTARERVGEKAETTDSIIKLKKLSKALVWLKRTGSPPGTVFMRIRKASDDSTTAVVGQITASTITTDTAGAQYEFTKSPVSIYAIQENDSVLIEYADGDDTNYIEAAVTTTDQIDTTNSIMVMYDALFTDYDIKTAQDLIMTAHEGGDTYTPTADEIPPPPPPKYSHDLHIFAGGYPYDYYIDQDDTTIENWVSAISNDIRFYRKILTTTELTNIFVNRRDRSTRPKGQICVIGFYSLPPFS